MFGCWCAPELHVKNSFKNKKNSRKITLPIKFAHTILLFNSIIYICQCFFCKRYCGSEKQSKADY